MRLSPWTWRGLYALVALGLVWSLGALVLATTHHVAERGPYDAIVVLGCGTNDDGTISPTLRTRVDHAIYLWDLGVARELVFTGGRDANGFVEAEVAAAYARSEGVPDDAMVLETTSRSTWENAAHLREILEGYDAVTVVTEHYHGYRAERVFRRADFRADADTVSSHRLAMTVGSMREVLAVGYYVVLGRM